VTGPRLNVGQPIVDENGTMAQAFRQFTQDASLSIPIVGTGSPEGVIEAAQYSLYLDSSGGASAIQYRKMQPQIGGDRTKGWILV
jgi:hypothetical protein|tara:strand:- start:143 stop:397 length:255 start_codon:yes stop_codon:yes gene_type:complete